MMRNKPSNSVASYLVTLLFGVLLTLAYAPFNWWWVSVICLSGFFFLLHRSHNKAKTAFAFGLGWFGAGISWVHVSIAQFGGLPLVASLGLMLILISYLALYPTLFGAVAKRLKPSYWPMCLPLIWFITEWLRSWVLTGFPWLSLGYSQLSGPLSGFFPIIGEVGVSTMLIFITCFFATFILNQRPLIAVLPFLVCWFSGSLLNQIQWVKLDAEPVDLALVQGNIEQSLKWQPEQEEPTIKKYTELSQPHLDADILIWPEAAIPKLEPVAADTLKSLDQLTYQHQLGFITGIVNYNFETKEAYNTLLSLGYKGDNRAVTPYQYLHANRYDKHHLLPIGEFIPLESWLRGIAPLFDLPMSSFDRGEYRQDNLLANDHYFAPAICFEIVFPDQIDSNITADTDFILTVSNDAWFGNSHGPHQHLQIAQVRAKEFAIPVIRATNNGITAIIDHTGNIVAQLPQFEEGVLRHSVQTVSGTTPFTAFGRWLTALLCLGLFIVGFRLSTREKHIFH